ncbi:MAG TPA: hypothetical protein VMT21_07790 [Gemmatimonadales bacterium]|nr:hypothetical protein [Gemmatimonadales bacterium]
MLRSFSFVHNNRTYTCQREEPNGSQAEAWWWFTVSHDGNRYAPFHAASRDTRASVQERIVAYYSNHLAHRAMTDREHWARRSKAAAGSKPAAGSKVASKSK